MKRPEKVVKIVKNQSIDFGEVVIMNTTKNETGGGEGRRARAKMVLIRREMKAIEIVVLQDGQGEDNPSKEEKYKS